MMSRL